MVRKFDVKVKEGGLQVSNDVVSDGNCGPMQRMNYLRSMKPSGKRAVIDK
jgi:hypothetical protein